MQGPGCLEGGNPGKPWATAGRTAKPGGAGTGGTPMGGGTGQGRGTAPGKTLGIPGEAGAVP